MYKADKVGGSMTETSSEVETRGNEKGEITWIMRKTTK
jgi:hypothetical protein